MGVSLCNLPVSSGFGGRTGSEVIMGYVFSQGALTAVTMVQHRAGVRRIKAEARCGLGIFPGSMAVAALSGGRARAQGDEAETLRELGFSQA